MERAALRILGRRVRTLRQERAWSQERLAEEADLHENYVSRLETGRQEPGLFVLLRLCRAFQLAPGELLDDFTVSSLRRLGLR
jgi:HTH-type transcriptional regulator, cell division transcriptional repressor